MKWSLIIPVAFIASVIMVGCTGEDEADVYEQPEAGEVAIDEGTPGAAVIGTEVLE